MLILFQILFTLFSLFAIINVIKRKKDGVLGIKSSIFWIVFWLLAVFVVLRPESTTVLANALGIGRGADFILYIAIVVIFYLIFRLHIKIEALNRDITKVVRKDALDNKSNDQ